MPTKRNPRLARETGNARPGENYCRGTWHYNIVAKQNAHQKLVWLVGALRVVGDEGDR